MKTNTFFLALFLSFVFNSASAQRTVELTGSSFSADTAHLSGNDFVNLVGDLLRMDSPSMVKNPSVTFKVLMVDARTLYVFHWRCDIVPCDSSMADVHFDRRGTIYGSSTVQRAKADVKADLASTHKVKNMMDGFDALYGNHHMYENFVCKFLYAQPGTSTSWYLEEYFCTSKAK